MKEHKDKNELRTKAEYSQGSAAPFCITVIITVILACIGFTIFLGRFMLLQWGLIASGVVSILSYQPQATFKGKCPHCNKEIWVDAVAYTEGSKFNCSLCGKALKLSNQYFCAINEGTLQDLLKPKSNLEQIKELKQLLDIGAITQIEYDTKKTELLANKN